MVFEENKTDIVSDEEELKEENAAIESGIVASLVDTEIVSEVQNSFLDYAMSVIVARALPDVRDGLKPVHRRVLFGMIDGGYTPDKPFVKSAKIVGDVMGKYHPHGDSAIYMTLVRMAQTFSMRYTLVSGHGNFGSMDGDDPAAMRYTEARMAKLALEMTRDINCDTVDYVPNYDGSLEEPSVLPSRFPNLLVNGSDGIAVGMATKMPPHNLGEVIDGINMVVKNPDCTVEELMTAIKAPDFPTGGIIYGLSGIRDAYATGRGTFRIRAKTEIVEESNGKGKIIISEIPYQVNKSNLVSKIGELAREKVIDGITSVKDYSKTDVRIEIETRKDVVPQVVLNQLFKNTQLEVSYGIINLCIVNGAPKVLNLKELINNYVNFQVQVINRRTNYLKAKDEARKHIIDALIIVHDILDVKTSNDKEARDEFLNLATSSANSSEFAERLMARYNFSEAQAKAVVQMTLGRLTGLETQKLNEERAVLIKNIEHYNWILESRENMISVVLDELNEIKRKYNDERRTQISNTITNLNDEDLIPVEDLIITLTNKGYIKRMSTSEFRSQRRGGQGVKGMNIYKDDEIQTIVHANSHTDILFFTNTGRVFRKRGHEIPEASRIGRGIPVINLLELEENETIVSLISVDSYENKFLVFATKLGNVVRIKLEEFIRIASVGKKGIRFRDDDALLGVKVTDGNEEILIANNKGKLARFNESLVRPTGRGGQGVKGMTLEGDAHLIGLATSGSGKLVFVLSEKGLGKMTPVDEYRITNRGAKGVTTINITEKTGELVGMKVVNGDEDYMVITNAGQVIRSPLTQVRECGRNSQGVKIITLKEGESVSSLTVLPKENDEENVEEGVKNTEENSVNSPSETAENITENSAKNSTEISEEKSE